MLETFVGYIRVSTIKQVGGKGIEIQNEAIKRYCFANDYKLEKIYSDEGLSAFKERPKYEQMLKHLFRDDNIKGVIVHDITRFGRSTLDLLEKIMEIDRAGKKFISIKDSIDISTKAGRLMLTMLSAIADYERDTITERMQAGRAYAKIHGTKSGKPMCRPKKEIDWDIVKDRRTHGYSFTKIAKEVGVSVPTLTKRAKEEEIK